MIDLEKINALNELLGQAKSALVIVGPETTFDQAASAIAIRDALAENGAEAVFLIPSSEHLSKFNLEMNEPAKSQLGNRDLLISFPYKPELVEKVSYHIDETTQRFCLVVKPQTGFKPLSSEEVTFEHTGVEADVIFLVGVHNLESLEQLYFGYEQLYETVPVITLHTFEPSIGTLKFDLSGTSCLSESVTSLITQAGLRFSTTAATNLLAAIENATDSFKSYAATAETFEAVANLLRVGARRKVRVISTPPEVTETSSESSSSILENVAGENVLHTSTNNPQKQKKSSKNSKKLGGLDHQPSQFSPGARG